MMEDRIQDIEKTVVRLDTRMESLVSSVESIAVSMKTLTRVSENIHVLEERCDSRSIRFDEADKVLHKRLDTLKAETRNDDLDLRRDIDKLSANFNKGMWLILSLVIVAIGKAIFAGMN